MIPPLPKLLAHGARGTVRSSKSEGWWSGVASTSAFTLIEVLAAIAIASVAFAILTQVFVNTLEVLDSLEVEADKSRDLRFVRSQVIQIADLDTLEEGGEIETLNFGEAVWEAEAEPTTVTDLFDVILRIEFENPEGEPFTHEERMYLLRPTWSDPVDRSSILAEARDKIEETRDERDW
jgi:prepilin-type N-terminal cleavage/methylation domain-containing protein